jgi:drug/metabolite transporter (DMT)-like permease
MTFPQLSSLSAFRPASPAGRGLLLGLTAAVFYGLIPTFTLPLYGEGPDAMSEISILFYRFIGAAAVVAVIMAVRGVSFRITRGEAVTLTYLSFLSDGAAMFLLAGYDYMPSGIATTLHFMYPVATAVIMMCFYHESRRPVTIFAVLLAVCGVGVLSWPVGGVTVGMRGVVLELISALCFALYLIRLNRSRVAAMDNLKLTFYVLLMGGLIFGAEAYRQDSLQAVTTVTQGLNLAALALLCTVVTNLSLVVAVKNVGSTTTAVLGALEPLTAVVLGSLLFAEPVTWNVVTGICLIIPAVIVIIFTRGR